LRREARAFDLALGLSLLGWAAAGAWREPSLSPARLTIVALNVVVGGLILARAPAAARGSVRAVLLALPSLVVAGVSLKLAPPLFAWPAWLHALFAAGGGLAIASFLFLRRSFAILPSRRAIVTAGPYRIVRHPGYVGELCMVAACGLARGGWAALALPAAAVALVVPRILAEERILEISPDYGAYAGRVRHRLVPLVW